MLLSAGNKHKELFSRNIERVELKHKFEVR